ncbi:MAG: hypothetical protein IPL15_23340 [Comamonadaceae bacterium]|uniref:hypothetical protein n=1 Tax=Candidatus Skiveiella danica TaxID=3386177 RepID=UPI003908F1E7|nr:hypothetical protein [Comamonadaceae bacterium]
MWPTDLMVQAGCVVHVGNNGAVSVKYGLIRPEDRSDMVQAARQAGEGGTDDALVSLPSPKTRPVHSEKLVRCLTAHRVAAVPTVLHLLTFVVAVTVTGIWHRTRAAKQPGRWRGALGLDMSQWWTATGASYFTHVSKARILEVVTEAVDANAASPLAALKKDAVVTGAEQTVAGTGWLPAVLRAPEALPTAGECSNPCMAKREPALAG